MTLLSQREAAARWGMGRATLQRAIRAGKVSASEGGRIEVSEMLRAFGEPASGRPTTPDEATPRATHEAAEMARLRAEVDGLKAVLAAKDETIAAQAAALRLLAAPPAEPTREPAPEPGLWAAIKRLW
jgi:hypothetical protein